MRFPVNCPKCNSRLDVELHLHTCNNVQFPEPNPIVKLSKIMAVAEQRINDNVWRERKIDQNEGWQETDPMIVLGKIVKNFGHCSGAMELNQPIDKHVGDIVVLCANLLDVYRTKHGEY